LESLIVELGDRSYPIHIGANLLQQGALLDPHLRSDQVCIVTNETVAPLYLKKVEAALGARSIASVILPDGEQYKTLDTVAVVYDKLLELNFSRSSTLIALGGGVIGDMTGFAAATYQRGVNFIQLPTTLLSQVDSSVGGKTGVNRPLGKNMVGAFYQPQCVLIDTTTLDTLPQRELLAGLAEVIKYGLINNTDFLQWIETNLPRLLAKDPVALARSIFVSCQEKATIVSADETETGLRAILNLGHTFGHAIETSMGYGAWLHGEAVATGMVMAADLSWRLGMLGHSDALRVRQLLEKAGLPVIPPAIAKEEFIRLMSKDKKAEQGKIRFVLLEALGKAVVKGGVNPAVLDATLMAGEALTQH
jgi:3-dehydroquinate synthase